MSTSNTKTNNSPKSEATHYEVLHGAEAVTVASRVKALMEGWPAGSIRESASDTRKGGGGGSGPGASDVGSALFDTMTLLLSFVPSREPPPAPDYYRYEHRITLHNLFPEVLVTESLESFTSVFSLDWPTDTSSDGNRHRHAYTRSSGVIFPTQIAEFHAKGASHSSNVDRGEIFKLSLVRSSSSLIKRIELKLGTYQPSASINGANSIRSIGRFTDSGEGVGDTGGISNFYNQPAFLDELKKGGPYTQLVHPVGHVGTPLDPAFLITSGVQHFDDKEARSGSSTSIVVLPWFPNVKYA